MKYDNSEEFFKLILHNISQLLLLPIYRTPDQYKRSVQLYNKMNPLCFIKPNKQELNNYLDEVYKLDATTHEGQRALYTAIGDLQYLIDLR